MRESCSLENAEMSCPIGALDLEFCRLGLHSLKLKADLTKAKKNDMKEQVSPTPEKVAAWLRGFFAGSADTDSSSGLLCPAALAAAPDFHRLVWAKLRETRRGTTVSYGELASAVGRPGAARAVGSAMRRNPLPLFTPCHRVIKSDGSLGNFSAGGEEVKRWLLRLEAAKK